MIDFTIKDIASPSFYRVFHDGDNWWISNDLGEAMELHSDSMYSMIDQYFKDNL